MIEVVGDTGYKADPADVNSILAQMECVYFDKILREEKASLALQKSFTFSWRKTVIETLNLYSKVSGVKKTDSAVSEIKLAGVE
jgi:glycosyltransferase involved in cell wall biosynthesis